MSAQIQTKFFGFTLGSTKRSEVRNKYKNEKQILEYEDGTIHVAGLKFAGHEWEITTFGFYDNKLMYVAFSDLESSTAFRLMESTWRDLRDKLWNKYSDYSIKTTSEIIQYYDGVTNLSLSLSDATGSMILMLYYSNVALKEQQRIAEEGEL